ncbi:MAG TPA: hypothetical protein VN622_10005 [Clostridia bacterium]|nr:hypothetical protein [Clostridia bacterium]
MLSPSVAHAQQQVDFAFGVGTTTSQSDSNLAATQNLGGGAFPAFSADLLFGHGFGVNGEVAWRGSQSSYQQIQPYRPIFYDVNAIWVPQWKRLAGELMAGIGGQSIRFYQPYFVCNFTGCTNYTSVNNFMGHFAGGVRFYVSSRIFVRPEAHLYLVHDNSLFNSGRLARYGASIGYTIGAREE